MVQARSIGRLALGGSVSIKLKGVESDARSVSLGSSGDLEAARGTVGKLSVSIAGSGDVNYYGDPRVSASTAGSAKVKGLGASPQQAQNVGWSGRGNAWTRGSTLHVRCLGL